MGGPPSYINGFAPLLDKTVVETAGRIVSRVDEYGRLKLPADARRFRDIETGDAVLVDVHRGTENGVGHVGAFFDEVDQKGRVAVDNSLREQWGLGPGDELLLEAIKIPEARQEYEAQRRAED